MLFARAASAASLPSTATRMRSVYSRPISLRTVCTRFRSSRTKPRSRSSSSRRRVEDDDADPSPAAAKPASAIERRPRRRRGSSSTPSKLRGPAAIDERERLARSDDRAAHRLLQLLRLLAEPALAEGAEVRLDAELDEPCGLLGRPSSTSRTFSSSGASRRRCARSSSRARRQDDVRAPQRLAHLELASRPHLEAELTSVAHRLHLARQRLVDRRRVGLRPVLEVHALLRARGAPADDEVLVHRLGARTA